jgi:hypothetical protein
MWKKYVTGSTSVAPLAVFRALFGFIMAVSIVRFAANGWIYELYVQPSYHFTFYGFEWVQPLGAAGMYALFAVIGLSALALMLGWRYRIAAVLFFLSFTYVELIDKTNYLNHYYFVSIISFLLIWVPANRRFSLDAWRDASLRADLVPAWTVNIFKLQLGLVYVYAGLAKLHPDWLLDAMPLRLWLPAHGHWPIIGPLLEMPETAYLFSWGGALYDLTIVFFLLWKRTRPLAYVAVIGFHLATALLFQIGMFPYIMILSTLIYFSPAFHNTVIRWAKQTWRWITRSDARGAVGIGSSGGPTRYRFSNGASWALGAMLSVYFLLQVLVPLRFLAYPGNLFWTEQGYRFSWRVMLMEKTGHTVFHVQDPDTGRQWQVGNWEYLTPNQEKMMSTQPDMILQFAHHLEDTYQEQGLGDIEITVEAHVTLNGRRGALLVDPDVDLTEIEPGFHHKDWLRPFPGNDQRWIGGN